MFASRPLPPPASAFFVYTYVTIFDKWLIAIYGVATSQT